MVIGARWFLLRKRTNMNTILYTVRNIVDVTKLDETGKQKQHKICTLVKLMS